MPVPSALKPGHAVVIGGSIAGLIAARVLADHFTRVTILERDRFPETPEGRKGTPQAQHIHVLLTAGRRALEQLFPGLMSELVARGAIDYDSARDVACYAKAGWVVRCPSRLEVLGATRDLIEWGIRQRILGDARITCRQEVDATRLRLDPANQRVVGLLVDDRAAGVKGESIDADLVIDAAGRGSRAPQWLEAAGFPVPRETVVNAFLGYASRFVRPPANWQADWKTLHIQTAPPVRIRGGVIAPVEGGRWIVTVSGGGKDYPGEDEQEFLDFVRSLADPSFAQAYEAAEPLTPIVTTRSTANRLRKYEEVASRPEGLLVIGDAVCAFNPIYAQGMSTAALGGLVLDDCLRRFGSSDGLAGYFQKQLAKVNGHAWLLATGEDYRYRGTEGAPPSPLMRVAHRYLDRVRALGARNRDARVRLLEVLHLTRSPFSLLSPGLVLRSLVGR